MHHSDHAQSASLSFSDLAPEEGLAWVRKFRAHSAASFTCPLRYAGYLDVPVSYFLCEKDLVIPPDVQKEEINMIEKRSGKKVNVTMVKSGHCPTISNLQVVVDWLVNLATVKVGY